MADTPKMAPFLMFEGQASEAAELYAASFPNSRVVRMHRAGDSRPEQPDAVQLAELNLAGLTVYCIDSPVAHGFSFTPASSLLYRCSSADELDEIAARMVEGGAFLMPPGPYAFGQRFAWLSDRFGVSWQLLVE